MVGIEEKRKCEGQKDWVKETGYGGLVRASVFPKTSASNRDGHRVQGSLQTPLESLHRCLWLELSVWLCCGLGSSFSDASLSTAEASALEEVWHISVHIAPTLHCWMSTPILPGAGWLAQESRDELWALLTLHLKELPSHLSSLRGKGPSKNTAVLFLPPDLHSNPRHSSL